MILPKKKKKSLPDSEPVAERYPWGLRLNLTKKEIDKIKGLSDMDAGEKVAIQAIGKIIEVRKTTTDKGNDSLSMEIQIQKIGIEDAGYTESFKKAAKGD
jgi:hypothetical protein